MNTLRYALSALLGAALLISLPVLIKVLIEALGLYHAAGMARVHHHTRETSQ